MSAAWPSEEHNANAREPELLALDADVCAYGITEDKRGITLRTDNGRYLLMSRGVFETLRRVAIRHGLSDATEDEVYVALRNP